MKKLITLIIFLSLFFGYSQTKEQDSLTIQLAFQNSDSSKVKTALHLVRSLYNSNDYDKALKYISLSERLSNDLNYSKGVAEITYYKALIYAKKGDYINAIDNYSKSKILFSELKDTLSIAKVNNSIGLIEIQRGNYNKGLEYSLSAIEVLERRNLKHDLCLAYRNLAEAYNSINNYDKAIEFNLKTLEIEKEIGNKEGEISSNKNLAELYSIKKEHRKAIEYYEKVLAEISPNNDSIKGDILPKLGGEYLQFNDYPKASTYLFEGLKLNRKTNNRLGLLLSLNNIGNLNLQKRNVKYAEIQLTEARAIAREIDNKKELLKNYKLMKALDSTTRNYARAFVWQRQYYDLKNSLYNTQIQNLKNTVTDIGTVDLKKEITPPINTTLINQYKKEHTKNLKQIDRYKLIMYALLAAFAVILTILMLIYLKSNSNNKYTRELEIKNKKIEIQNEAILEQTKHLEDINKVKDRLFSIVSHDLKDSLSSIKGFIDLLKDGSLSNDEFNNLIPELSENANNASLLLFNLLNWSKSQMQSLESNPSLFDVQEVFEDKIRLLEQNIERKDITIKDHTLRDFIYADKSMVEIIIQNLLTNAIKFSKIGDTITISNHISNGNSIISVADTGVGISNENIDKLFKNNAFTTIGTKNEKGTGLGLSICKELVELNHGKIWVESALNVGSTFYIQLPKSSPKE